jgi:hypothetical protein
MQTGGRISDTNWKELYQHALLETDAVKIPYQIAEARKAVLDRVEQLHTKPVCDENRLLHDATIFTYPAERSCGKFVGLLPVRPFFFGRIYF